MQQNPGWELISISKDTLAQHLPLTFPLNRGDIPHAAYSDIVRVSLLAKYGGVWVDATLFCTAPLDTWLSHATQSGFFAFEKPKTTVASWFLASEKNNPLVYRWEECVLRYWKYATRPNRYFWVHYLFEYLIQNDTVARAIWHETPHISSEGPYAIQRCLKRGGGSTVAECARIILDVKSPIHKLDWKIEVPEEFLQILRSQWTVLR